MYALLLGEDSHPMSSHVLLGLFYLLNRALLSHSSYLGRIATLSPAGAPFLNELLLARGTNVTPKVSQRSAKEEARWLGVTERHETRLKLCRLSLS